MGLITCIELKLKGNYSKKDGWKERKVKISHCPCTDVVLFIYLFIYLFIFCFLGPHPEDMKVLRLGANQSCSCSCMLQPQQCQI